MHAPDFFDLIKGDAIAALISPFNSEYWFTHTRRAVSRQAVDGRSVHNNGRIGQQPIVARELF